VGTGDSDKPQSGFRYKIEEQADLIAEMIEELKLPKIHLIGVSYGGVIALNFATRYPERTGHVVCIEGGVVKPEKIPNNGKKGLLRWPLIGDFFISAIRSGLFDSMTAQSVMGGAWEGMDEGEKKEIVEIVSENNKTASRISWYRISRTFENSKDFVEEVKGIQVPVLYLYGKRSEFRSMAEMNVQFFKTYLPEIEMVDFEDGVHDLELQKPREVSRLVLDFFERNRKDEKKEAHLHP
jgi:pimeloyl-ACP methyl ester carboxylesterase